MCETAEKNVIVPVTPDLMKHEVNLTGKLNRRRSLYSTSYEKPLPRYLSHPEGSCHDICKYGKKLEFDATKRHSIYLKYSVKRKYLDNQTEFGTPQNRQRGHGTTLKNASQSESNAPKNSRVSKPRGLPISDASSDLVVREESLSMKPKTSPMQQSSPTSKHSGSFLEKGSSEDSARINRMEHNHQSINRSPYPGRSAVKEGSASVSPIAVRKKTISPAKWIQLSSKPPASLKSKASAQVFSSTLSSSGRAEVKGRQDCRIWRNAGPTKQIYAKTFNPQASSPGKPIVNRALCIYSRKRTVKTQREAVKVDAIVPDKAKEKTHVIEQKLPVKWNPRKLRYDQSSKMLSSRSYKEADEESESTIIDFSESASSVVGEGRRRRVHTQKDGNSLKQKQRANIGPDDKALPSHRMSFNRGKVISSQKESTSQRRLRFRQAKAVSDSRNSGGDMVAKIYRKKNYSACAKLPSLSPETPTVVLRHQDVQEKKDAQALFNDIIEATANKLVESRKSKVKALVGAFETVISLHERTA